jgi:hypothetical protein
MRGYVERGEMEPKAGEGLPAAASLLLSTAIPNHLKAENDLQ